MKLIKFGHSCVRLEDHGAAVVIDPGVFSDVPTALRGAAAVLITHEHPDHIDVDALSAAARADERLRLYAPAGVAATLSEFGDRVTVTEAGATFDVAGFEVIGVGGQHAVIHPLLPVVANVGYVIDGTLYHPGDSFTVSTQRVSTVLVPIHAPWSKLGEVVDFVIACRAERAFQIHDGLLNQIGLNMVEGHVTNFGGRYGTSFAHLDAGDNVTL